VTSGNQDCTANSPTDSRHDEGSASGFQAVVTLNNHCDTATAGHVQMTTAAAIGSYDPTREE
jgi:hypothetical protein